MNRKLLNGLLVLAVAAGGVGTFTSCKDEDFRNDVLIGQIDLQAQIDAIRNISDSEFNTNLQNWLRDQTAILNKWLNDKTSAASSQFSTYEDLVDASAAMWSVYNDLKSGNYSAETQDMASKLYDWYFNQKISSSDWYKQIEANKLEIEKLWAALGGGVEVDLTELNAKIDQLSAELQETVALLNAISELQAVQGEALQAILNNLAKQVTSINLNQTVNPVFGTINLPVGLSSSVLATYVYDGDGMAEYMFPAGIPMQKVHNYDAQASASLSVIKQLAGGKSIELENGNFSLPVEGDGNMGNAYITINPTSVDFSNLSLDVVNSLGETVMTIDPQYVAQCDEELHFGVSRADDQTGVYKVQANAPADYEGIKIKFEERSELVSAVKDILKNRSLSDIATLADVIYKSMENIMPAYALRVSWDEEDVNLGETTAAGVTKSVLSNFDLAATVIHPLSYETDLAAGLGAVTNKRLRYFSPLADYLDRLQDKLHIEFSEVSGIEPIDLQITFTGSGTITAEVLDANGNPTGNTIELSYSAEGIQNPEPDSLDQFIKDLLDSIGGSVNDQLNDEILASLNKTIDDLNEQLKDLQAQLDDFNKVIDDIKNSSKLGYAQKLVDVYNKVAEKVNHFLENPNEYLQVMMAYNAGKGVHHMSTDPACPVTADVTSCGKDAIELFVSSYTGDMVVPSYLKYVAITGVSGVNSSELAAYNEKACLNQVFPGNQQRIAMNVSDSMFKNKTLKLTYVSVDYHGYCSLQDYYVFVK